MNRTWLIGFIVLVASLATPLIAATPARADAPPSIAQAPPSISIVSPKVTTVSTLGFRIEVTVSDFILDQENYGGPLNVPGHGHIHYTVDGALAGATWLTIFNIGSLSAGSHTVRAELRNNNHSALDPPVFREIAVTAVGPSIAILAPKVTAVSTLGLRVEVSVAGLDLDEANYGGTNVAGHGHIHYIVDGTLARATTATFVDLASLPAGSHTIRVDLRNNDHSPLSPAVFQEITVAAAAPSIAITTPEVLTVSALGFRMEVSIGGFEIDEANYGGTNVAGRGHIHYILDGTLAGAKASTVFDFPALAAGNHAVRAELRNNDHSPLATPVFQDIAVTAGPPAIAIAEPLASASVSTLGFRVRTLVANFTIDPENYAGAKIAGRGHIHLYIDGTFVGTSVTGDAQSGPIGAGSHVVRMELRNNDHSALATPVFAEISVTATVPSVQATASAATIVTGESVLVTWTVAGFVLDPVAVGGANEAGRGHVHVLVDGVYLTATAGTSAEITGLSAGTHTIRIELHNNDHSLVTPAVGDDVTVQVTAPPPAPAPVVQATLFYGVVAALVVVIAVLAVLAWRAGKRGPPM